MFLSGFVEWWTQHRVFQNNQSGPILLIHFSLDCLAKRYGSTQSCSRGSGSTGPAGSSQPGSPLKKRRREGGCRNSSGGAICREQSAERCSVSPRNPGWYTVHLQVGILSIDLVIWQGRTGPYGLILLLEKNTQPEGPSATVPRDKGIVVCSSCSGGLLKQVPPVPWAV